MNPFKHLDKGHGYEKADQFWYKYFEVQITQTEGVQLARFKKHRITGTTFVFQANCMPKDNCWNERGYGWGIWKKL